MITLKATILATPMNNDPDDPTEYCFVKTAAGVIGFFMHTRNDGLEVCLRDAAIAVKCSEQGQRNWRKSAEAQ